MQRIDSVRHRLALHGAGTSRQIEREALAALPPLTLVQRAGQSVARLALAIAPHARHVWIATGPGNNGADGLYAALALARAGKHVTITGSGDSSRPTPEATDARRQLHEAGIPIIDTIIDTNDDWPNDSTGPIDLAVDALLGLGSNRPPEGRLARHVDTLNALSRAGRCPVLAVDVPSGLDADTGQTCGGACVKATHTLSLLTLHPGLYTGLGRDHAGQVWFDDLDVDASLPGLSTPDAWLDAADDARAVREPAGNATHKGSFGDVAVVGGARGMTGAALLAGRAAHAAGAGRVYVSLLDDAAPQLDPTRPELMFRPQFWMGEARALAAATIVCGCGGGKAVVDALPALLRQAHRLVLDADALNEIATDTGLQSLLSARASHGRQTVLTPHPLEAARLLGTDAKAVQADRLNAARALADRYACVVVVKGSGTIIAAPGATPVINRTGNGSLATAGTGDVLAGWLGGIWSRAASQHEAADHDYARRLKTAFDAATAAVYLHGDAAERSGMATTRAADLVEQLLKDRSVEPNAFHRRGHRPA